MPQFISKVAGLLISQLTTDDLYLPENANLEYINGISVRPIHKPVTILERSQELCQDENKSILNIVKNPIEMAFIKKASHESLREYRIVFLVSDIFGHPIPVKPKIKLLNILPDIGISEITSHTSV